MSASIEAPASEAELAALIAAATGPLAIEWNGTQRAMLRPVQAERTVSTRALTGITLYKPEELLAWMQRKAEAGGFALESEPRVIPKPRSYFHQSKTKMNGVHHAVEFQGVLRVTDAALFKATVHAGIGSAKAFGFGLLALAPA